MPDHDHAAEALTPRPRRLAHAARPARPRRVPAPRDPGHEWHRSGQRRCSETRKRRRATAHAASRTFRGRTREGLESQQPCDQRQSGQQPRRPSRCAAATRRAAARVRPRGPARRGAPRRRAWCCRSTPARPSTAGPGARAFRRARHDRVGEPPEHRHDRRMPGGVLAAARLAPLVGGVETHVPRIERRDRQGQARRGRQPGSRGSNRPLRSWARPGSIECRLVRGERAPTMRDSGSILDGKYEILGTAR